MAARREHARYTSEAQQEDVGFAQLNEQLAKAGWIVNPPRRDIGEDAYVVITEKGRTTGLRFELQLKTRKGPAVRTRDGSVSQRVRSRDLEHWEKSLVPVVLVLWDVEARAGVWQTVRSLVSTLDASGSAWRGQLTTTVVVPKSNGFDAGGLRRLRRGIADVFRPLVEKDGEAQVSFRMDDSEEGRATAVAFSRALDEGTPVVIDGRFVSRLEMPEWHRRLYGELPSPASVELKPTPPQTVIPVRLEIHSARMSASLPHVELCAKRHGRELVELTNEAQRAAFAVSLTVEFRQQSARFNISREKRAPTLLAERDALQFLVALGRGGTLRFVDERNGTILLDGSNVRVGADRLPALECDFETFERLALIQRRIAAYGDMRVPEVLTPALRRRIEKLFLICRDGRRPATVRFSADFDSTVPIPADEGPITILRTMASEVIELLGVKVPVGTVRSTIKDTQKFMQHLRFAQQKTRGKRLHVAIDDLEVEEEYLSWKPEGWGRLADLLLEQGGQITYEQAQQAGYTDLQIESAIEDGLVRRDAETGLLRLAGTPEPERGELIATWLRTRREGVFSHQTALDLWDLCDIMPTRIDVTIPKRAKADDLGPVVVVHRADLSTGEKAWAKQLPVTTPPRTLDDVRTTIAPDLFEQAVNNAFSRGWIDDRHRRRLLGENERATG